MTQFSTKPFTDVSTKLYTDYLLQISPFEVSY